MRTLFLFVVAIVLLLGCKKKTGPEGPQGDKGETGPPGAILTGTITGRIKQYDASAVQMTTDLNTTTVSISGTTLNTITDTEGNYSLINVPSGTYELQLRKP